MTPKQSDDTTERVIDQPVALDMILKHLIDNYGEYISFSQIKRDVFPTQEPATIIHLCSVILNFAAPNAVVEGDFTDGRGRGWAKEGLLKANSLTKQFLQRDGGFVKWYADLASKLEDEKRDKELSRQALSDQIKTNSLTRKISIWALIISIIAILATIGQVVVSLLP